MLACESKFVSRSSRKAMVAKTTHRVGPDFAIVCQA